MLISIVSDYTLQLWKSGRKTKPGTGGWVSGNAPCCVHNNESADTRGRGGLHIDNGAVAWHCFNCGFKASYQPGRHLTFKFRNLLGWLGAPDSEIKRLVIEAIRLKDLIDPTVLAVTAPKEEIVIKKRSLPADAQSFAALETFYELSDYDPSAPGTIQFIDALQYVGERAIDIDKYMFYLTPEKAHSLNKRVIVPCYWKDEIIGYTGRALVDTVTPKYHNNYESNYVFNTNMQLPNWKFVLVMEGPFDAMAVDGVAVLGNEISEIQADIIESLGREVIVVADRDASGVTAINAAIKYGWAVSFPIWQETCKDVNEAVCKYGKLFVLKAIIDAKETNTLKIQLKRKKLYPSYK